MQFDSSKFCDRAQCGYAVSVCYVEAFVVDYSVYLHYKLSPEHQDSDVARIESVLFVD